MNLRGIFKRESEKPEKVVIQHAGKTKAEPLNDEGLSKNTAFSNWAKSHHDSMLNHSESYSDLLTNYVTNSSLSLKQKRRFKEWFFWVTLISLMLAFALFFIIVIIIVINNNSSKVNMTALSAMLSSFISLLALYNIIPKIIAEYLFNIEEDKNMTEVIKSIQQYDTTAANHTSSTSNDSDAVGVA